MTKLGRTVCGYVPHLLSNIQKTIRAYEKSVFSRRLLCFVKNETKGKEGCRWNQKRSRIHSWRPRKPWRLNKRLKRGETEVIGSLTDFNWLSDELATK